MANPRYPQPREQQQAGPLDKLGQVLPFLNLAQGQQQLDQGAQHQQLATVLQMLGLQQEQAKQQQSAQEAQMHLQFLRDQLGVSSQNAQAEQGLAGTHNDLLRQQIAQSGQQHQLSEQQAGQRSVLDFLGHNPQIDPAVGQNYLSGIDPVAMKAITDAHQAQVMNKAHALLPAVQAAGGKIPPGVPDEIGQAILGLLPAGPPAPAASATPTSLGASVGSGVRGLPQFLGGLLQNTDNATNNFGQDFFSSLFGLSPPVPDPRTFQQKSQQSKAWPWQ